jgi:large subunit ribosomal protein L29
MATTNTMSEIRNRETGDLRQEAEDKIREVFNLRFQKATEKAENPERIRALRKEIARIKTVLREREMGIRGQSLGESEG